MEEWKEYKLGEVVIPVRDRIETSCLVSSSYISTENMLPNKAGVTLSSGIPSGNAIKFENGDVLISNIRPYFKKIWRADKVGGCSADVICLRASEKVEPLFLYYLLSQDLFFDYVMQGSKGTKMPRGDKNQIMQWPVLIPSKSQQNKIASLLSSLDDKIEVNRRINDNFVIEKFFEILLIWMLTIPINDNLEQQAQALFKSWFVDFEPFRDQSFVESELGMIPDGWRVGRLGDKCKCILGGTPSRNKPEYWDGDIAWINSGEVNKFRITTPSEYITEEGLNHSATKLLPRKTTVLAITGATLGQVSLLEIDTCANQSVIGVLENDEYPYSFVYPLIKERIGELMSHMTGGAQQHINKNNVEGLDIVIPSHDVMTSFRDITFPIYEKIGYLCQETDSLAELRDTLLPKLMSGEIKVFDKPNDLS